MDETLSMLDLSNYVLWVLSFAAWNLSSFKQGSPGTNGVKGDKVTAHANMSSLLIGLRLSGIFSQ